LNVSVVIAPPHAWAETKGLGDRRQGVAETAPNMEAAPEVTYYTVLSVTDEGIPPLTRYRRVLVTVPTAGTAAARQFGCDGPSSVSVSG
jgi:hypothetical protein